MVKRVVIEGTRVESPDSSLIKEDLQPSSEFKATFNPDEGIVSFELEDGTSVEINI